MINVINVFAVFLLKFVLTIVATILLKFQLFSNLFRSISTRDRTLESTPLMGISNNPLRIIMLPLLMSLFPSRFVLFIVAMIEYGEFCLLFWLIHNDFIRFIGICSTPCIHTISICKAFGKLCNGLFFTTSDTYQSSQSIRKSRRAFFRALQAAFSSHQRAWFAVRTKTDSSRCTLIKVVNCSRKSLLTVMAVFVACRNNESLWRTNTLLTSRNQSINTLRVSMKVLTRGRFDFFALGTTFMSIWCRFKKWGLPARCLATPFALFIQPIATTFMSSKVLSGSRELFEALVAAFEWYNGIHGTSPSSHVSSRLRSGDTLAGVSLLPPHYSINRLLMQVYRTFNITAV